VTLFVPSMWEGWWPYKWITILMLLTHL